MLRKAEAKYWREQLHQATSTQEFWNVYRKVSNKRTNTRIGPLKNSQEEIITDDTQKAELMNNFFVDVGKDLAQKFKDNVENKISYVHRITPTVDKANLNTEKLTAQLRTINPKKASGPGSGDCKELSILREDVQPGLEIVFDKSITQKEYPNAWKLARVKTAHKKGEKQDITNNGPLSMINIPRKFLEGQLCDKFDKPLERNGLISDR